MRRRLGLFVFFLLCLGVSLALNMPLVHILSRVEIPESLRVSGLNGSLLNGTVEQLVIDRVEIDSIDYQADVSCLLSFAVCYQFQFEQGKGRLRANLFDQSLKLNDFELTFPLENLSAYADKLLVQPSGLLNVAITSLSIRGQKLGQIDARVLWLAAGVAGESINLGDYELMLTSDNQAYQFKLQDKKALLVVDGKGQLKPGGQYSANILIQSKPGLQPSIKTALEFVAKKQGLNKYVIRKTGTLPVQIMSRLSFPEQ